MASLSHPECVSFHAAAAPPSSPGWLSLGTQVDTLVDLLSFSCFSKNSYRESEKKRRAMGRNRSSGKVSFLKLSSDITLTKQHGGG